MSISSKVTESVKNVLNSRFFLLGVTLLALLIIFVPLAVAPPDDDQAHLTTVSNGKSMINKVKSARLAVVVLATLFVFIPLGVRSFIDIAKGSKSAISLD